MPKLKLKPNVVIGLFLLAMAATMGAIGLFTREPGDAGWLAVIYAAMGVACFFFN